MILMIKKNILSFLTALVIIFLSFTKAETFSKVNVFKFPYLDKFVHFCMYFLFMIILIHENRHDVKNTRNYFALAIIPLIFGILIEFLQSWLTVSRKGDFFDAFFNFIGIFLAVVVCLLFQNICKRKIK
jgi:VanZ family protein